ncbi:M3 family metallopeptidase [Sphingobacteriaceae bacterium WQ 2009]|uniref:M3 family metallopeptidase n=1 Tax=Rhinopithecimicrobium faecis TaxID=2820698 RepID=A0A8T4HG55_9SPHI|nr:M3 family metallopeptidase [Sphingobacteriaceae bacterium WQ 2009]
MNILNKPFETPFDTAPFAALDTSLYEEAFSQSIANTKAEIDAIVANTEAPTFENTIEALAFSGMQLERISSIFFNLHAAETNDDIQRIAQVVAPQLSALGNDITLNPGLFSRVKEVYEKRATLQLTEEQLTLLTKNYKDFVRNGANLPTDKKDALRDIDARLSVATLQYSEHILADTNAYKLHLTEAHDVAGVPEGALEEAAALAKAADLEGWIFTLDYPSYIPFITYASNRERRRELAIAAGKKGFQANENNNEDLVLEITKLRLQRANLLGYASHADFVLEERMAQSPEKVLSFLQDLLAKAKPAADAEMGELTTFANQLDGIAQLEKWDSAYYAEKLKQQKFQLDDELLKPYFKLENVLAGAFDIAGRLFDLSFHEVHNIDKYQEDVRTFEVKDAAGKFIAILYTDFFPRKGKRNGAWMTSFKSQYVLAGKEERPHISIVCNFTKPTATKPSLLTFNEVTTLFHEFGHALHGMLANTRYPTLSGTSVFWDFVELPSQIMENWCYEPEALALFARHYESEELIPMAYIQKIKESASFMEGMATVRQLSFGLLDMGWHGKDLSCIMSVRDFELKQFAGTQFFPDVVENAMSTSFSHIFAGGYAAGYYSYKWAEVLDADAFAYFQEQGIFNTEVAHKFRDYILSKGGTVHPMTLYKQFRGQEPSVDALLRRAGLLQ